MYIKCIFQKAITVIINSSLFGIKRANSKSRTIQIIGQCEAHTGPGHYPKI